MRDASRDAVRALRNLGFDVSASALRQWRHRGHIGQGPGYDVEEIAAYIIRRVERVGVSR